MSTQNIDAFLRAYLITALWSSTGDDGEPLDDHYTYADLHELSLERCKRDCENFLHAASGIISAAIETSEVVCGPDFNEWERAAHDFWLTRNGHGAGFWDGDWPEPFASQLTDIAKTFREVNLVEGCDGELYCE
jgi:hypothetical protein